MKRLIYISLTIIIILTACAKEEKKDSLPAPPVITLDSQTSVYTTKVGQEITISPSYQNAGEAVFAWTLDGTLISEMPELRFSSDVKGSYYIMLTVTNAGGEASEELRIDVAEPALPEILLPGADKGFVVIAGAAIVLEPVITSPSETTSLWTVNGKEVSTDAAYTFAENDYGEYAVTFSVNNEDGQKSISFTVNVCSQEEVDFSWSFEQDTYNVSKGRTIRLRVIDIVNAFDAEYIWAVDGKEVQRGDSPVFAFEASTEGAHSVMLTMSNGYLTASHGLTVNVCPPEGTYRRDKSGKAACDKVYEFLPAPGQLVNEGYTAATMSEACAWAEKNLAQNGLVSLGGFGGYIVVGFDHSIMNDGSYNIAVTGNPFEGSSEPGIVYVMQDENGDGLPNDTWYELKGSEYGKPETCSDYAVTYFKPEAPGRDVLWRDNRDGSGMIKHLAEFHPQDYYYPAWVENGSYTLRGTCLESRSYDTSGEGTFWVNPAFDWGYADNFSSVDRLTGDDSQDGEATDNRFKISDAVRFNGKPADLAYIDFVKIQTAVNQQCGWIGELSTDISGVKDYNMMK